MGFIAGIDQSLWVPLAAIPALIYFALFFAIVENAYAAASKTRIGVWEKDGDKRAAIANNLRENNEKLMRVLRFATVSSVMIAVTLTTWLTIRIFGETSVIYTAILMIFAVLVFVEILPKIYVTGRADVVAIRLARTTRIIVAVLSPLTEFFACVIKMARRLLGGVEKYIPALSDITEEELRGVIAELHHDDEAQNDRESSEKRAMLRSILDLVDITVEDVMTHRRNVSAIDADDPMDNIVDQVLNSPYSRFPVWQDDPDNMIGIIHTKALLRELRSVSGNIGRLNIRNMLLEPWFIPETTSLFGQLQAFRERKEHFAVVVDEYGSFMGIVTLEDILEEIVGDIDDEHDMKVSGVRLQGDGSYLIDGTVTIRDLNRELDWNLPDEAYSTIAGLVLYESKMLPETGQNFSFYKYRFKIMKRQRNQMTLIQVIPPTGE